MLYCVLLKVVNRGLWTERLTMIWSMWIVIYFKPFRYLQLSICMQLLIKTNHKSRSTAFSKKKKCFSFAGRRLHSTLFISLCHSHRYIFVWLSTLCNIHETNECVQFQRDIVDMIVSLFNNGIYNTFRNWTKRNTTQIDIPVALTRNHRNKWSAWKFQIVNT